MDGHNVTGLARSERDEELFNKASVAAQKIRNLAWAVDQLMISTDHHRYEGADEALTSACWTINNLVGEVASELEEAIDRRDIR